LTKALSISALSLMIGGCATTSDQTVVTTPSIEKPICCTHYSDFFWLTLAQNDQIKVRLDSASPAWSFPEGHSYFSALQFSALSGQVRINISSLMTNGQVFAPKVVLLNAHFEPQTSYGIDHFQIRYANALETNRYETSLTVNAEETPYMIIYSDASHIGDTVVIPHPAKRRAAKSGEPFPIVSDLTYHHALNGKLEIRIETLAVRQHSAVLSPISPKPSTLRPAEDESILFYHNAIKSAIRVNNIEKALALLDEAKRLGITNAQRVFIEAINKKPTP
jgi:maltose operon protein